jgi:20S proteasome subunit beta 3
MELNGGSVVAMAGKNCVAIASDMRLGNQALTVATNFEKVHRKLKLLSPECGTDVCNAQIFPVTERIYLGMAGLATDVATLYVFLDF